MEVATGAADTKRYSPEFSGEKIYTTKETIQAICNHGVVVETLHSALKERGKEPVNDRRDLFLRSKSGRTTHIFEVKTTLSSTDLHQAVGQVMLYGVLDKPSPRRILVLPKGLTGGDRERLKALKIRLLEYDWNRGNPEFRDLDKMLR